MHGFDRVAHSRMCSPPPLVAVNVACSTLKIKGGPFFQSSLFPLQIPEKIWSHPPDWVLSHVRAGQEVFMAEIEEAGFVLEREITLPNLRENYFLVFQNKN